MPRAPHNSTLFAGNPAAKRAGIIEQYVTYAVDALPANSSKRD